MEMNNSSELMLEALLRAGASASDSAFMRRIDELDAETPDAPPSKEREKKLRRLLRRAGRSNQRHSLTTAGKAAAAVLIIALAGLAAVTIGADAIRSYFLNFILDEGAPGTEYNFTVKETQSVEDYELYLSGQYEFGYVPEGYSLTDISTTEHLAGYTYEKEDGSWFAVDISPLEGNFGVDTENATIESLNINGYEAVYISNDRRNSLVWYNSYNAFIMVGTISKEEMIKIAENVEIKRK